jgi:hypothetical protein
MATLHEKSYGIVLFLGSFYNPLFVRNRTESYSQKGKTYGIVLYRTIPRTAENQ